MNLQRVSKDSKVDLLQYDIVVPEPLEIKSQAVNNFVCKGFKVGTKWLSLSSSHGALEFPQAYCSVPWSLTHFFSLM